MICLGHNGVAVADATIRQPAGVRDQILVSNPLEQPR
jgi:hypothetical protein